MTSSIWSISLQVGHVGDLHLRRELHSHALHVLDVAVDGLLERGVEPELVLVLEVVGHQRVAEARLHRARRAGHEDDLRTLDVVLEDLVQAWYRILEQMRCLLWGSGFSAFQSILDQIKLCGTLSGCDSECQVGGRQCPHSSSWPVPSSAAPSSSLASSAPSSSPSAGSPFSGGQVVSVLPVSTHALLLAQAYQPGDRGDPVPLLEPHQPDAHRRPALSRLMPLHGHPDDHPAHARDYELVVVADLAHDDDIAVPVAGLDRDDALCRPCVSSCSPRRASACRSRSDGHGQQLVGRRDDGHADDLVALLEPDAAHAVRRPARSAGHPSRANLAARPFLVASRISFDAVRQRRLDDLVAVIERDGDDAHSAAHGSRR